MVVLIDGSVIVRIRVHTVVYVGGGGVGCVRACV